MKVETWLFGALVVFFLPVALLYGYFSGWEPVGTGALGLSAGLFAMIGGYFAILARRMDDRPEDRHDAVIAEGAGDQGVFSPWSWWPLVLGVAAGLIFLGLAIGYWISGLGIVVGIVGLLGWVLEFSTGQHAH